jgi:hypothetical protein
MEDFGFSEAFKTGFVLIRRRPVTVAAWGAAFLLIALAPTVIVYLSMRGAGASESEADLVAMLVAPASVIAGLSVVLGGIYRAVLEPDRARFFGLRLGKAELIQLFLGLSLVPVFLIGFVVAAFGLAIAEQTEASWAMAAALLLPFLVWPRFLAAGPMAVAEGRYSLTAAWRLMRGRWLKGLLLSAASAAVVGGIVAAVVLAGSLAGGTIDAAGSASIVISLPFLIVFPLLLCVAAGASLAIFFAPWAEVYRRLSDRAIDAEVFA